MTGRLRRGLRIAIGITLAGLAALVPVLISVGPLTLGLFMAGAALIVVGVLLAAMLLPGSTRDDRNR